MKLIVGYLFRIHGVQLPWEGVLDELKNSLPAAAQACLNSSQHSTGSMSYTPLVGCIMQQCPVKDK